MKVSCTLNIKTSTLMCIVFLMLLMQPGKAGFYSCWGPCLNRCALFVDKKFEKKTPCFLDCVTKCFPQPGRYHASSTGTNNIPLGSISISQSSPASEIPRSSISNDPQKSNSSKSKFPQIRLAKKYYCIIGCTLQSCMTLNRGTLLFLILQPNINISI